LFYLEFLLNHIVCEVVDLPAFSFILISVDDDECNLNSFNLVLLS